MMRDNGKKVQFHSGEVQYASTDLLENSESDLLANKSLSEFSNKSVLAYCTSPE